MNIKNLEIVNNRSNVSVYNEDKEEFKVSNVFSLEEFKEFTEGLRTLSDKVWKNVVIKEADSMGSDYFEYYDRKLDNNGYLSLRNKEEGIEVRFERPFKGDSKVYQFDKRKMGSFLYDCYKVIKDIENK